MRISALKFKNKHLIKFLKLASYHYASMLMSKRLINNLDVKLVAFNNNDFYSGFCSAVDDRRYPREFEVEINTDFPFEKMMTTLAHEFVHVKQFARGELSERLIRLPDKTSRQTTTIWKKEYYHPDTDYHKRPWEIEADAMETLMFHNFIEYTFVNRKDDLEEMLLLSHTYK
jgi:hypothetical protein